MFYFTGLESVSALNAMMPALYGNQSVARRSIANSQTMAMDIEEPSKLKEIIRNIADGFNVKGA